jgi:hypothetical protein
MGFRVSWIARSGTSTKELLEASGRSLTGERHEFPDVGFYLLELPKPVGGSWAVLIADGSDNFAELDESQAQSLSKGGNETLYFWCSDTVMVTELKCFIDGAVVWSIEYNCEDTARLPAIRSDVPAVANEILVDLRAKQRADDGADFIYDLTAEVGRRLVGFRHDMDPVTDDVEPFQVLSR